ncbi:MAG TPA: hotdog domain-containing protein [Acidimicrobiales bacterium]|nr:hotdog domain-containing protein [Acidimicrobiales bacterium]
MGREAPTDGVDPRRNVGEYFRLQRWEIPSAHGGYPELAGRAPVDDHQRGAGGGLRTGGLLTGVDSIGGMLAGLSVQPEWIVTTSMMATVTRLSHRGPLRLHARVLRRGRNAVVAGVDVVDEGTEDLPVASVVMTSAVLDPGGMHLHFERPIRTAMPPPAPDPQGIEEFFGIEPGAGPVTRLDLADHLRNPWGILHGGAVATLADAAACRAVAAGRSVAAGRAGGDGTELGDPGGLAAGDMVIHYLRPTRVGPVEARCKVIGGQGHRTLVRVAVHDVGADHRLVDLASVAVLEV